MSTWMLFMHLSCGCLTVSLFALLRLVYMLVLLSREPSPHPLVAWQNLRTAPQSRDQQLVRGNLAMYRSVQTGNPVRVIRGYKLRSRFAPEHGYRYDGMLFVRRTSPCYRPVGCCFSACSSCVFFALLLLMLFLLMGCS